MILFAGDIHGRVSALEQVYKDAIDKKVQAIIQVGDFGIYWPDPENGLSSFFENNKSEIPFFFCDGNHENHTVLDEMYENQKVSNPTPDVVQVAKNCYHIRRGTLMNLNGNNILFMGGAQSYLGKKDSPFIFGKNWWPREMPSHNELEMFKKNYEKADIVVTHDCPSFLLKHQKYHKKWSKNGVPQYFKAVVEGATKHPNTWFFGHHHEHEHWDYKGVRYYCCGKQGESWLYSSANCVKTGIRILE